MPRSGALLPRALLIGLLAWGIPAAGVSAAGIPAAGIPAAGIPAAGTSAAGVPATGVAAPACWQPDAVRVLIAFASDSGRTAALAREVAAGAATVPDACVWAVDVADVAPDVVRTADAIVLGSPVHNANPAARLLAWLERWPFQGAPLRDKVGAAFVTAGGISAGEEVTQLALLHTMLVFGMVVVGGADWQAAFGASAISGEAPFVTPAAAQHVDTRLRADSGASVAPPVDAQAYFNGKARGLGARVAALARRLRLAAQRDALPARPLN